MTKLRKIFLAILVLIFAASGPLQIQAAHANTELPVIQNITGDKPKREKWCAPLGGKLQISRKFSAPAHKYGKGHRGIDVRGNSDTVLAPAAGKVSFVGKVVDRHVISIKVNDSLVYSMEPVKSSLKVGDTVAKCAPLGTVEAGGHTQAHEVHLGVRENGNYINPAQFFVQRPILKPLNK